MEHYEFVTIWRFDAPVEKIWTAISKSDEWSDWWKGVLRVEQLRGGDENGIGAVHRSTWKSALPYKLVFDSETVRVEEMKLIEIRAFGELEGSGIWSFVAETEKITRVRYDWRVRTTKSWMNFLAPLAKPFFQWNHDTIMEWGAEGLARKLGCRRLDVD